MFTQPDSVIQNVYDPQMLNRYAFERNNPYRYVDENGHEPVTVVTVTIATVALLFMFGMYMYAQFSGNARGFDDDTFISSDPEYQARWNADYVQIPKETVYGPVPGRDKEEQCEGDIQCQETGAHLEDLPESPIPAVQAQADATSRLVYVDFTNNGNPYAGVITGSLGESHIVETHDGHTITTWNGGQGIGSAHAYCVRNCGNSWLPNGNTGGDGDEDDRD